MIDNCEHMECGVCETCALERAPAAREIDFPRRRMIYEIINPSDPVTLEGDDDVLAATAVLILGSGKMGLEREDGSDVLPILFLGTDDSIESWMRENLGFGVDGIKAYVAANGNRMADFLETALVGKRDARKGVMAAMKASGGDVRKAIEAWNDAQRSSLNDICGACFSYARAFRKRAEAAG